MSGALLDQSTVNCRDAPAGNVSTPGDTMSVPAGSGAPEIQSGRHGGVGPASPARRQLAGSTRNCSIRPSGTVKVERLTRFPLANSTANPR